MRGWRSTSSGGVRNLHAALPVPPQQEREDRQPQAGGLLFRLKLGNNLQLPV